MVSSVIPKIEANLINAGASLESIQFAKELVNKVGEDFSDIVVQPDVKKLYILFGDLKKDRYLKLTFDDDTYCFYQIFSESTNGAVNLGTCYKNDIDDLITIYKNGV